MAAINGITGNVSFKTGSTTNVKSWSLDRVGDTHDSTDFTSTGERTFATGLKGWSGSFVVNLDDTTALPDVNQSAAIVLTASTGRTYSGTAILTGIHPSVSIDGLNESTIDFQGTGTMTIA